MRYKIRYGKKEDLDFVLEGLKEIKLHEGDENPGITEKDKEDCLKAITEKRVLVVEDHKNIGYIEYKEDFKIPFVNEKFLWIHLIYVREKHRGKEIAKVLYDEILKIAKEKDYNKIYCDVYAVNSSSLNFFEKKMGFKPLYTFLYKEV